MEELRKAREVYESLVQMLVKRDWKFDRHDDKLLIKSGISGEDLPIQFIVRVIPENEVVQFLAPMPFNMPEDKRIDAAIAVAVANYGMINGSFDFDISDGEIRFRLTTSYVETELSDELLERMILVAASTSDKYNDRFFMLAKGMMTVEQFIELDGQ